MVRMTIVKPRIKQDSPRLWNQEVKPIVVKRAPIEPVRGQGLYSTRWNG